ncbi:carboxymuconolactone decarboxylase family protein [Streptacidiphilus jiangxiensis]|uniref:Alkylhydroperoxidase AhpD family core domain-containing protein n=1 Tax=Streptacidiphilus jiangxiensis TaxID=235985 RepID=A0A1H7PQT2_STRJI|nr:carboxymuconolactone decarboxylase family protein [Streptacidiphilus jiangxiensis]SEL38132.1 alkylhydroperoxidase AhpD family core domain-containing protein [Streptacidiphilus jiangxiensis]
MTTHAPRTPWARVAPDALQAMLALEETAGGQLDPTLRELVRMRASGLNGCAYCLDLHAHDALAQGESLQRLVTVAAWEEARHLFTEREQAALALTDAVTRLGEYGVPDAVWDGAAAHFDEKELVRLLLAIVTINAWNRLGVATRLHVKERA